MTPAFLIAAKSILIAAVTLGLLRLAARRSAAERSAIAHLGLCALLALPLAAVVLPSLSVFIPKQLAVKVLQVPMPGLQTPISVQPATAPLPAAPAASPAQWVGAVVLCAYLVPAVTLLLFMCTALVRLARLRASARALTNPVWRGALASAQRRMGSTKGAALLIGGHISSPISWGLIHPVILLNEEILAATAQAEAIIAHELAHVIQHDWVKLILARVATAAFWFNPLAWLLAAEAHQLREEAADDAVLAAHIAGPDYAALLIDVARCESRGFFSVVHGVAPGRSALHRRITRVLDDGSVRAVPGRRRVAVLTAATLVLAAPLAALRFQPVAAPAADVPNSFREAIAAAAAAFTPAVLPENAPPAPQPFTVEVASAAPVAAPKHAASKSTALRTAAPSAPKPSASQPDADPPEAQAGLDQFPQALRTALDGECISNGGTPGQSPNLFTTADLNGDGVPDLVFDRTHYECGGATVGSGRYGTTLTIFLASPSNNVAQVYTGSFYGSWVEYGRDGKPSLIVADAAGCDSRNDAWQLCGHRLAFGAPDGSGLGIESAVEKNADR